MQYLVMFYFNQKKERVSKAKNVLEDINVAKSDADSVKSNETVTSDSIPKKANNPPSSKGNPQNIIFYLLFCIIYY